MYLNQTYNQMTFSDQFFGMNDPVCDKHPYVLLEQAVNWKEVYHFFAKFYDDRGRNSIPIKNMILLLLIKHVENISDERLILNLSTNLAMQKVLNVSHLDCQIKYYDTKTKRGKVRKISGYIDPSSLSSFRKRIGVEGVKYVENIIIDTICKSKKKKSRKAVVDATVIPSNIKYPNDINLLETARRFLISITKKYSDIKYRTYTRVARKLYLTYIKLGRKKREITKKVHGKMIRFVKRNYKQALDAVYSYNNTIPEREKEILSTIGVMLEQQIEINKKTPRNGKKHGISIPQRIVSIFKPYVRPISVGKIPNPTEFGSKVLLEMIDGIVRPLVVNFTNESEKRTIKPFFERYKNMTFGADRGFYSRENARIATEKCVKHYFVEKKGKTGLKKTKAVKKIRGIRSALESRIGLAKRRYGSNKNLYSRGEEGEEQWVRLSFLAMNINNAFYKSIY